jgi:putative transposase
MKKKLNIPKDFWKDFKDRKDFDEFFNELFKEGISQMLKAEMTDHLGYEKNAKEGDAPIHTYKENQSEFSISKVHLVVLCV